MSDKVINTIPDGIKKLRERFTALAKREVEFGSMGPAGSPTSTHTDSDLSVADILEIHEYGKGVPERPVVRAVYAGNRRELGEAMRDAGAAVLDDVNPDAAAVAVGMVAEELLHMRLDEVASVALDEDTLEDPDRPPGAKPLQVGGEIRESLRFHVKGG